MLLPLTIGSKQTGWLARYRDEGRLTHIGGERRAKVLSIAGHRTPLVPLDDMAVPQGFSPVHDANDFQPVQIGPQYGRNDGHPLARPLRAPSNACGGISSRILGSTSATRQAALNSRRTEYPESGSNNGWGAKGNDINHAASTKQERKNTRGQT